LGRHGSYNGLYYGGNLQHMRIYDYAITDDDIAALYAET